MTKACTLLVGALLLSLASGFVGQRTLALIRPASVLAVSSVSITPDELSSRILLNKARECAFSDYSNGADAKEYLLKILEIESGCVSGMLAGSELCENIDEVADIVAHLRQKVQLQSVAPGAAIVPYFPLSMVMAAILVVLASTLDYGQEATPFTLQEWVWAAKGGYVSCWEAKCSFNAFRTTISNNLTHILYLLFHPLVAHHDWPPHAKRRAVSDLTRGGELFDPIIHHTRTSSIVEFDLMQL